MTRDELLTAVVEAAGLIGVNGETINDLRKGPP